MCIDTVSQAGEIVFSWSVDGVSLTVGREFVLDHIFDTVGVYNICVSAFNSGEFCDVCLVFTPVMCSLTVINPLKGSGIRWLHFKVFSAIQV